MHYSALEFDSVNRRILTDDDLSVNGVLWASDETGVCIIDLMNAGVTDYPDTTVADFPFRVVDMRDGGEDKPDISTLFGGRKAVTVVGGSPNNADHMNRLPFKYQQTVISVNHRYLPSDYFVFADRHTVNVLPKHGKRVSYWGDLSDYSMDARDTGTWFHRNSSLMALWLACNMARGGVVVLAGFDLIPDYACPTLEHHLVLWRKARDYVRDVSTVVAVNGTPLAEVFGSVSDLD